MKIIILGPPGSGKGTQANLIKNFFNLKHISSGEIIRQEIEKNTEIGNFIKNEIKKGALITDDLIITLLDTHIKKHNNILLDGFPRTLSQAIHLSKKNIKIDYIINLIIKNNIILKRLKYRIIFNNNNYNILYKKSKINNIDNETGEKLIKRLDDSLSTIQNRLIEYNNTTQEIINWYKNTTNIIEINGETNSTIIFNKIKESLKRIYHEKNL